MGDPLYISGPEYGAGKPAVTFTVALCQKASVVADKEHNLTAIEDAVEAVDADLVLFPELFVTGYLARDRHRSLAEPLSGPSVQRLSSLASEFDTHLITGMTLADPDIRGLVYNAAVYVGPGQEPRAHRKTLLPTFGPFEEDFYFGEGRDVTTIETPFARIGVSICYELFFPEVTKRQALDGADLLVNVSASPTISKRYFEALLPTRAIETTCFTAYCNLVGQQDHLTFWGGSRLIGPRGNLETRAEYYDEDVVTCEVDLRELPSTRSLRPVLRDTSDDPVPREHRELDRLTAFHGGLHPWAVVGFRMGLLGLQVAGQPGEPLSCEVACPDGARPLLDGLQVTTGCTTGRGTLTVRDGEEVQAAFRGSREAKVRVRSDAAERAASPDHADAPEVALALYNTDVKELFEVS